MKLKAKLRAWLIDLVREAIRSERAHTVEDSWEEAENPSDPPRPWTEDEMGWLRSQMTKVKTSSNPIVITPSFEQLQAEAIAAQEKYYEPERA